MTVYKTFVEFTNAFATSEDCMQYLCDLKWANGYNCIRCAHSDWVKGRTWYYRRCRNCGYDESCTAHTLFHKIKFPLVKAFWITYQVGTMKKGMSTLEISRQYKIHQETAWFFKRKVQQAMHHLQGTIFSRESKLVIEQNRNVKIEFLDKLKQKSFCVEKTRRKNPDSMAKMISDKWPFDSGSRNKVDLLSGYLDSNRSYDLRIHHLFNLKNWMRGIHHRVSPKHIQFYFDEYYYRFRRRNYIKKSVPKLFESMIALPWMPYALLTCDESR